MVGGGSAGSSTIAIAAAGEIRVVPSLVVIGFVFRFPPDGGFGAAAETGAVTIGEAELRETGVTTGGEIGAAWPPLGSIGRVF